MYRESATFGARPLSEKVLTCDPGRQASADILRLNPEPLEERESFADNLVVRVHVIIAMIGWTGLAPSELEFPLPGSLTSTFLNPLNLPKP